VREMPSLRCVCVRERDLCVAVSGMCVCERERGRQSCLVLVCEREVEYILRCV